MTIIMFIFFLCMSITFAVLSIVMKHRGVSTITCICLVLTFLTPQSNRIGKWLTGGEKSSIETGLKEIRQHQDELHKQVEELKKMVKAMEKSSGEAF